MQHLPRLRLHFDRKHLGRLRQLINRINTSDLETEAPVEATRSEVERSAHRLEFEE